MVKNANSGIKELYETQGRQRQALVDALNGENFNIEKMIYIQLPTERYFLRKDWIPAVECFFCVDNTHRKWAISQGGNTNPKIFDYSDFYGLDVEINGRQAGDTTNNAIIGFIFGGLIGAAAGAAMTRKYGTIKNMIINIRVNDFHNPVLSVPIINAPLSGLKDGEYGLNPVMTFASEIEQTFKYISDNTKSTIN
jgi:hypothetical protein